MFLPRKKMYDIAKAICHKNSPIVEEFHSEKQIAAPNVSQNSLWMPPWQKDRDCWPKFVTGLRCLNRYRSKNIWAPLLPDFGWIHRRAASAHALLLAHPDFQTLCHPWKWFTHGGVSDYWNDWNVLLLHCKCLQANGR